MTVEVPAGGRGRLLGSVRARLLRPLAGLTGVVALLLAGVFFSAQRDRDARESAAVAARVQAARSSFEERIATVRGMSKLVGHTPAVAEGVDAHDLRTMLDVVEPVVRFASLGLVSIYAPDGVVLARGDAPAVFGKPDDLAPWIRSLGGAQEAVAVLDSSARLVLVAATPLGTVNYRHAAWAVAGLSLDAAFLHDLKTSSGVDLVVTVGGRDVLSTRPAQGLSRARVPLAEAVGVQAGFQLWTLGDDGVERTQSWWRFVLWAGLLLLVSALALLLAAFDVNLSVTRPLRLITSAMTRLAAGDRSVEIPLQDRQDEIGALGRAADVFKRAMSAAAEQESSRRAEQEEAARKLDAANRALEQNLAELRRTQEQLILADRRTTLGTLSAGLAHEINNPLAFILSNLQFVKLSLGDAAKGPLAPDALKDLTEAVDEATQGAQRVRQIVRSLKTVSRGDEGDRRTLVDVEAVCTAALDMAWSELKHRAKLVRETQAVPKVMANEVRLTQVMLNLLINAAQAIDEKVAKAAPGPKDRRQGRDDNEIRVRTSTDAFGRARIEISDTGTGIPPELRGRLFDPFFTTKPVGQGTGLGLSTCQGVVHSLGGTIEVDSTPGVGATFIVTLPAAPAEPRKEIPSSAGLQTGRPKPRLLIIDDEPLVRAGLERLLSSTMQVETAVGGQEALDRLAAGHRYDVVLCDLMMPGVTGEEFARAVEARHPELQRGLYFLTGGAVTPGAQAFADKHAERVFEKPLDTERFRVEVERLGSG
jgi:signal transduction histidine kinase